MLRSLIFCVFLIVPSIALNCVVKDVKVALNVNGTGLSANAVEAHLRSIEWKVIDVTKTLWSCVDGRALNGILGTPAGDSGEFVLALTIYEQLGGDVTSDAKVYQLFADYLDTISETRGFYMHTDDHALEILGEKLKELNLNATVTVTQVPPENQDEAKNLVVMPPHLGCGHLRLLIQHSDQYVTPVNTTYRFLRAFFDYLWNHQNASKLKLKPSNYVIVTGNHTERAVVNIVGETDAACSHWAPLVIPKTTVDSVFINHIGDVGSLRSDLASFFAPKIGKTPAEFKAAAEALAKVQLGLTVGYLAAGEPIYTATYTIKDQAIPVNSAAQYAVSLMAIAYLLILQ